MLWELIRTWTEDASLLVLFCQAMRLDALEKICYESGLSTAPQHSMVLKANGKTCRGDLLIKDASISGNRNMPAPTSSEATISSSWAATGSCATPMSTSSLRPRAPRWLVCWLQRPSSQGGPQKVFLFSHVFISLPLPLTEHGVTAAGRRRRRGISRKLFFTDLR